MRDELLKKLQSGEPIDARDALLLEQELESGSSAAIANMVSELPDPELSLAWRSELNDKLRAMAPAPKEKFQWFPIGAAVAGVSCAVICFAIFSQMKPDSRPEGVPYSPIVQGSGVDQGSFGTALVRAHLTDEAEVSTGLRSPRRTIEPGYDWDSLSK